ncbi:plasminogen-like, partial [Gigantopelta aegis]|uniref:plasminogen-like n=1 Tax=Gigantopelta aegis TaxID=1735272 RepID=UPI001B888433
TTCYVDSPEHGILYSGNKSTTVSGLVCQRWTVDAPHIIDPVYSKELAMTFNKMVAESSNFCRGFRNGKPPWCYTVDEFVKTESCGIPRSIPALHCYTSNNNGEILYRGIINVTKSNFTCQSWASQQPHPHNLTEIKMGNVTETLQEAGNSCRPSPGHPPWCYTTDPDVTFDYCDIPLCDVFICGDPPKMHNAKITTYDMIGNRYKYVCVNGTSYVRGSVTSKCRNNSIWEGPTIVCARTLKGDIWKRITAKISACGVAERTPQEAKEKWRSLKGAVLNKQKRQTKTGGGPPDKPMPYEDIIVTIIGENSNLYTGIEGNECKIPPRVPGARTMLGATDHRQFRSVIYYKCLPGFQYVTGTTFATCDISGRWKQPTMICLNPRCYVVRQGNIIYTGPINVTKSNYSCQAWSSQTPHKHNTSEIRMAALNQTLDEAGNWCRPSHGRPPWCYTTNPDVEFDYCDIPQCRNVLCGSQPKVPHAEVVFCERDMSGCTYKCTDGSKHIRGSNVINCQDNGQWGKPAIVCAPFSMSRQFLLFGFITMPGYVGVDCNSFSGGFGSNCSCI